ncbi:MAG: GNAT family N-acetyltransferase [Parvibaculum sp.]|nr:GNAT family N-acetyltransferase [Parvibaculum sp.]
MPSLETARLILRPWRAADLEPFAAMSADPRVMETLMGPLPKEESDNLATRLQSHIDEHGFGFWAIELPGIASFIGFTGLQYVNFEAAFTPAPPARAVEIGWRLAHDHWGDGYASEAARASLDHAFGPLNLDEIVAFTAVTNERSRSVMSRLNMTHNPADDFDHPRMPDGHPLKRHVLYRIGRST